MYPDDVSRSVVCNSTRMFIFSLGVSADFHNMDDFKHALSLPAGVDRGITGNVCRKSPANKIIAPPNWFWLFRKSYIVRSNASKDLLCAIVHPSQTMSLLCCSALAIAELLER